MLSFSSKMVVKYHLICQIIKKPKIIFSIFKGMRKLALFHILLMKV